MDKVFVEVDGVEKVNLDVEDEDEVKVFLKGEVFKKIDYLVGGVVGLDYKVKGYRKRVCLNK